jgi:acyl carrier protein
VTQTAEFVTEACRSRLRLDALHLDDDLRKLGADSLFVLELACEIEDHFDIYVPAETIESLNSVRDISTWIDATRSAVAR